MKPIHLYLKIFYLFFIAGCSSFAEYQIPILAPDSPDFGIHSNYTSDSEHFKRVIGSLLGPKIIPGNDIEMLVNGDQIFPSMLASIESAKKSINFETYIYWQGYIGEKFAKALSKKAQEGIEVNIVIDWFGSDLIDKSFVKQMKDAGAHVKLYNSPEFYDPLFWFQFQEVNYRTHRKLLIVDGETAFVGGVGIADLWLGNADSPEHWRDNHYKVTGPIVASIQSEFLDNWLESGGKLLDDEKYFPPLTKKGDKEIQAFKSSPNEATAHLELMFRIALHSAKNNIRIATAYFVPDPGTLESLVKASKKGVKVEIIVPGRHIDQTIVRYGSRSQWGKLLEAGVKIYEYQPTMYHTKLLIIDDNFSSIGSANFDNRSFHLNDEANLNVFGKEFSESQIQIFEHDLKHTKEITLQDWENRPLSERFLNSMAWMFQALL